MNEEGQLFNEIYMATGAVYPAYFPADIYSLYPDPNYPDAEGIRVSNNVGQNFENPARWLLYNNWTERTTFRVLTDLILEQDLRFITKGLSAKAMISLTTSYTRLSEKADQALPRWSIDWNRYDQGDTDIWNSLQSIARN